MLQNHSVPASSSSLLLTGLTPGALYRLQAASVSGELHSKPAGLEARTGASRLSAGEKNSFVKKTDKQKLDLIQDLRTRKATHLYNNAAGSSGSGAHIVSMRDSHEELSHPKQSDPKQEKISEALRNVHTKHHV